MELPVPDNLSIRLDVRSQVPIYTQIVEQIRLRVASGQLRPGDQLPTVRQLATELRVNFNTVARAYRQLDEAGLISTQRGRGTYIWEPPTGAALEALRREGLAERARVFVEEARRDGYTDSEITRAVQAALSGGDEPVELHQPERLEK